MTARADAGRLWGAYWLRIVAASLGAALVMIAVHVVLGFPLLEVVGHSLVAAACLGGLAGLLLPPLRHRVEDAGFAVQWSVTMGALLGVGLVGTALTSAVLVALGWAHGQTWARTFTSDLTTSTLLTAIIGIALTLYEAQRRHLDTLTLELRTKELEHAQAAKMALEAQLSSLASRLQPHFLFNTLNAISALIQEDPERAERTVERLAALLRFALDTTGHGLVPLAHELKIATDYLEIEKTRLGERLAYELDVSPAALAREVPPLSVQTLVENSVKHAIAPRPRGGRIRVTAAIAGDELRLGVWDDGPGFMPAAILPGHGLDNLRSRLAARFGAAADLTVTPHDGGTLVTVALPGSGAER